MTLIATIKISVKQGFTSNKTDTYSQCGARVSVLSGISLSIYLSTLTTSRDIRVQIGCIFMWLSLRGRLQEIFVSQFDCKARKIIDITERKEQKDD